MRRAVALTVLIGALAAATSLMTAFAAVASARVDVPAPAARKPAPATRKPPPRHTHSTRLVRIVAPTSVTRWPNGPIAGQLSAYTPLGSPSWLWVVSSSSRDRWLRVVLPWRPNGQTGWIARRGLQTTASRISIDIDLSRRRLSLLRGDRSIAAFRTGVGGPSSPTPAGKFSVTDRVATGDAQGPFGWYAFGLSGHQPMLPAGWTGGDQLAIHGTNDPSSIGAAVSAGCLHVSAAALTILKQHVPLGTPVVIHG